MVNARNGHFHLGWTSHFPISPKHPQATHSWLNPQFPPGGGSGNESRSRHSGLCRSGLWKRRLPWWKSRECATRYSHSRRTRFRILELGHLRGFRWEHRGFGMGEHGNAMSSGRYTHAACSELQSNSLKHDRYTWSTAMIHRGTVSSLKMIKMTFWPSPSNRSNCPDYPHTRLSGWDIYPFAWVYPLVIWQWRIHLWFSH